MSDFQRIRQHIFFHFMEAGIETYADALMWRPEDDDGELDNSFYDLSVFHLPEIDFYDSGATKWVIGFHDMPEWVIKVPFKGCYTKNQPYSGYKYADCAFGEKWNYCQREVEIYEEARKQKLDFFFPKTFYLGSCSGIPVYLSQRLDTLNHEDFIFQYHPELQKKSKDIYSRCVESSDDLNVEVLDIIYIQELLTRGIKEKDVIKIIMFLQTQGINDFCTRNFGVDKNKCFKMLDFSGCKEYSA